MWKCRQLQRFSRSETNPRWFSRIRAPDWSIKIAPQFLRYRRRPGMRVETLRKRSKPTYSKKRNSIINSGEKSKNYSFENLKWQRESYSEICQTIRILRSPKSQTTKILTLPLIKKKCEKAFLGTKSISLCTELRTNRALCRAYPVTWQPISKNYRFLLCHFLYIL